MQGRKRRNLKQKKKERDSERGTLKARAGRGGQGPPDAVQGGQGSGVSYNVGAIGKKGKLSPAPQGLRGRQAGNPRKRVGENNGGVESRREREREGPSVGCEGSEELRRVERAVCCAPVGCRGRGRGRGARGPRGEEKGREEKRNRGPFPAPRPGRGGRKPCRQAGRQVRWRGWDGMGWDGSPA